MSQKVNELKNYFLKVFLISQHVPAVCSALLNSVGYDDGSISQRSMLCKGETGHTRVTEMQLSDWKVGSIEGGGEWMGCWPNQTRKTSQATLEF